MLMRPCTINRINHCVLSPVALCLLAVVGIHLPAIYRRLGSGPCPAREQMAITWPLHTIAIVYSAVAPYANMGSVPNRWG